MKKSMTEATADVVKVADRQLTSIADATEVLNLYRQRTNFVALREGGPVGRDQTNYEMVWDLFLRLLLVLLMAVGVKFSQESQWRTAELMAAVVGVDWTPKVAGA